MVSGSISRYTFNMNFFTHRRQLYKERSHLGIIWGKGNGALCYVRYFTPPKMLLFIKILYTVHTAVSKIQLTTGGNHCCQVPAMDTFSQISQKISKCSIWKHFGDPNRVKGAVSREKWTVATGVGVPQTEVLA